MAAAEKAAGSGGLEPIVAAALLEALDMVLPPEPVKQRKGVRPGGTGSVTPDEFKEDQRRETRRRFLSIIREIEDKADV